MHDFSDIAILIPTINEETLSDVVAAAKEQAPGAEINILGFGSAREVAEKHDVNFIDLQTKTRKTVALNRAIRITEKPWLIILDADAIPMEGWGQGMLEEFKAGTQLFSASVELFVGSFWMRTYNFSMLHEFTEGKPTSYRKHLPAISLGFTRELYDAIGPFSEQLNRSEDYEWSLRALKSGISPKFISSACILHYPVNKTTFASMIKYWVNSGADNLAIRQLYADELKTPFFMKSPLLIVLLSPIISIVPTFRVVRSFRKRFLSILPHIPFIYLTKIAWCIGVYQDSIKKGTPA